MKLEKGMLISVGSIWYIAVEFIYSNKTKEVQINCVCDHANNIYGWNVSDVEHYVTLKEIGDFGWNNWPDRKIPDSLKERGIPFEEIVVALSGSYDDRFEHWER